MTDSEFLYQDDEGTAFEVVIREDGVVVDISTATLKTITFKKPGGSKFIAGAAHVTDGKDGKLQYIFLHGDLSEYGLYKYQAYVELPSGKWHTTIGSFDVRRNL
jgi:hypothetical protein